MGIGERSGIPHVTLPPGAQREWRRRDLIAGVVSMAASRPLTAIAQQKPMPVIGYVSIGGAGL